MSALLRLIRATVLPSLLITAGVLGFALIPGLSRASPASFTLFASITTPAGWGFTSSTVSSPGPDLTVAPGESVTVSLTSADRIGHNWGVDYNGNGIHDPGEPLSPTFGSTVTNYTFTATTTPGTYKYWCFIHTGPMFGNFIVQSPPAPDFRISASAATPASFVAGNSATSTITLTSLNNFVGNVTLVASTTTPVTGLTFSFTVNPVMLTAGGTSTSILTISTTTSTPAGTYTITVNGTGGSRSHSVTVNVIVGGDFSISASQASLSVGQGSSASFNITLQSLNGFSGDVTLTTNVSPSGPSVSPNPSTVTLSSGTSGKSTMTISTSSSSYSSVSVGTYIVTVTGTISGPISHHVDLTLNVTSQSNPLGGSGSLPLAVVAGVVVVVAAVILTVFAVRRSRVGK